MNLDISWTKNALSELGKLNPSIATRILRKVRELGEDPSKQDVRRLSGSDNLRLRIGDYRVLFSVSGDTIFILKVGHRRSIYARR
jgi:mRNA interferase RelE/StbE